ncbi:hypothetical protein GM418_04320 [Maribellus comscasis]|uniref:Uncharacterized protein n=1 Tax=Maribellus comscasis TaxID=2681766 RepID=A0A6I6JS08_9BACT|nr:hypothetical protein [Maribellus comscasis]QGY42907.1 hypothetical protein GM418_04320 [Maribellus comscasis]
MSIIAAFEEFPTLVFLRVSFDTCALQRAGLNKYLEGFISFRIANSLVLSTGSGTNIFGCGGFNQDKNEFAFGLNFVPNQK